MACVRLTVLVTLMALVAPSVAPCMMAAPAEHAQMPCCKTAAAGGPSARPCCAPADPVPLTASQAAATAAPVLTTAAVAVLAAPSLTTRPSALARPLAPLQLQLRSTVLLI